MIPFRSAAGSGTHFSLRNSSLRSAVAGAAAVLVAVVVVPPAASALTISGTNVGTLPATSPVHVDARTNSVIYYLDLHAGVADERFSVLTTPPEFATVGGRDEGQAVDGPLQFGLQGPGTVGQTASDPAFGGLCSSREDRFHGYESGKSVVDVALPAGANTTLAIRYDVGRRAPWIDTDLQLHFGFAQSLIGQYDASSPLFGAATPVAEAGNLTATQDIPVMASEKGSKIGAHLILTSSPAGTYGETRAARSIAASSKVKVSGRLLPALSGKSVLLQWAKPGGALRTAAKVRTTKGGRFSALLRTPGKGEYELWASYPNQPGTLTNDSTSCPLRFKAR